MPRDFAKKDLHNNKHLPSLTASAHTDTIAKLRYSVLIALLLSITMVIGNLVVHRVIDMYHNIHDIHINDSLKHAPSTVKAAKSVIATRATTPTLASNSKAKAKATAAPVIANADIKFEFYRMLPNSKINVADKPEEHKFG